MQACVAVYRLQKKKEHIRVNKIHDSQPMRSLGPNEVSFLALIYIPVNLIHMIGAEGYIFYIKRIR